MLWAAQKVCGLFMALKCSAWTWMRKRAARIGTATSILSRSNSNAAAIGFLVSNVTRRWRITKRRSGPRTSERQRPFCAERAGASYRSRNIWSAARCARRAGADSIRAVQNTTICILNEFVEGLDHRVRVFFGDLGVPFTNCQSGFHSGLLRRVQLSHHI